MKLNLRLKTVWRVALVAVVVAGLFWYVAAKRAEWEMMTRPLGHMDDATAVLAPLPAPQVTTPAQAATGSALTGDYLALARLERDRTRATEEEKLRQLAADTALLDASREEAGSRLTALVEAQAREAELERLLRDKGFADALVTLGDHSGRILIRGQGELDRQELAQLSDLAKQVAGLKPWELTIILRP